jgi:PAS domain S-box-containing protein
VAIFQRAAPSRDDRLTSSDVNSVLDSIPHIVWLAAPDGSTSYVNDFCVEYTGRPRAANYKWGWTGVVHPDDVAHAERQWLAAICSGTEFRTEYRIHRRDGSFRWHGLRARPLRRSDGVIHTWVGSATDIDDEKLFEASLQQSRREAIEMVTLLDSVDAAAPVGIKLVDQQFRVVRINDRLARVNGIPASEHIGRTVSEVAPALWAQLEPIYRRALAGESCNNVDLTATSADDPERQRHWLASFFPVRVAGDVVGVGNVVFDVTDRYEADEFRAVVMDNMAEGLYAIDATGSLTYMNRAASRMLGWDEDELRGKKVHKVIHFQRADGEPLHEDACDLVEVRVGNRTIRNGDDAFTRKDGTIFPVAYSAAPLRTGTAVTGVVVVFRDATEEAKERDSRRRELDALTWIGRVRDAIDEHRLVLFSQPIEPLTGGRASEELLLRMIGRDGSLVLPGSFLPVAEKYGLITEIDRWTISQAMQRAARGDRVIEVNVSAASLGTSDLLPFIRRELKESGADPANLVFEITETALMKDTDRGEAFAHGLAELGCGLALDDFGTGFGSFTYLKRLPVTHLKIDIEFVRDLTVNEANRRVVQVIVGLARAFGLRTIAEGVENEQTLEQLRAEGVDYVQGFHIGRPEPIQQPTRSTTP